MTKTLTIGISALALTLAGTAFAQQTTPPKKPVAELTRAQAQTKAEEMFARLDANKDGVVNSADREARMKAMRESAFTALDTDKNGQISRDEFMNAKQDGKRGKMGMHNGGEMRGHWGKQGRGMKGADGAKNASVTKAQFVSEALTRFDKLDANKDGKVTAEERKAGRDAMRSEWRAKKAEKAN